MSCHNAVNIEGILLIKHLIYIPIYDEKLFTKHSISVKVKWASIGFEYGWIF